MGHQKALLVIDAQANMFAEDFPVYAGSELLKTIQALIERARGAGRR